MRRTASATLLVIFSLSSLGIWACAVPVAPPEAGTSGTLAAPTQAAGGPFRPTGSMGLARSGHTATLLDDGRVLIVGGTDGTNNLNQAVLYYPNGERGPEFRPTGSMGLARSGHTATLLDDGRVLIVGGASPPLASAELYQP